MIRDIYHNMAIAHLLDSKDIVNHTDVGSDYVDLQGFEAALFKVNFGTVTNTDANNKVLPVLQVCDALPNLDASWADAATADIQGAFAAVLSAATDQLTQRVGYIGTKRYARVWLNFTSAGANPDHCPVSIDAILMSARHGPESGLTLTTGTSTG